MPQRRSKRKASTMATAAMASACAPVPDPNASSDEDMSDLVDTSDSSSEEDTDDEDNLHGPCGGKAAGADPPPAALRTFIGEFVAKEFKVDNQEDMSLFWGQIVGHSPDTKKFDVRLCFAPVMAIFMYFFTHQNMFV